MIFWHKIPQPSIYWSDSFISILIFSIGFKYIPEGTVSLVAAQTGETFSPYVTKRGGSIYFLRSSYHTADDLFLLAEQDNVAITWLVRLGGFLVMFIGLQMVSKPLEVGLDGIPCIGRFAGNLMGGVTTIAACTVAAALSTLTIAIAWVAYRPLLALLLFAIVGGLLYIAQRKADSNQNGAEYEGSTMNTTPNLPNAGGEFV